MEGADQGTAGASLRQGDHREQLRALLAGLSLSRAGPPPNSSGHPLLPNPPKARKPRKAAKPALSAEAAAKQELRQRRLLDAAESELFAPTGPSARRPLAPRAPGQPEGSAAAFSCGARACPEPPAASGARHRGGAASPRAVAAGAAHPGGTPPATPRQAARELAQLELAALEGLPSGEVAAALAHWSQRGSASQPGSCAAQRPSMSLDPEQHDPAAPLAQQQRAPSQASRRPSQPPRESPAARAARRGAEDAAVAATCPPQLAGVLRWFGAQAEAFAFADECNAQLPLEPPSRLRAGRPLAPQPAQAADAAAVAAPATPGQAGGAAPAAAPAAQQASAAAAQPQQVQQATERAAYDTSYLDGAPPPAAAAAAMLSERLAAARRQFLELQAAAGPVPEPAALRQAAAPAPATASGGQQAAAAEAPHAQEPETPAQRHQEAIRTFCVERYGRNGKAYRSFAAASYRAVWAQYRATPPHERHWYEIIREGRPCHLYFDLEYSTEANPSADGPAMVDALLAHADALLRRLFGLGIAPAHVFELDSSSAAKFSRHLTVRLPGAAWEHSGQVGAFVAALLAGAGGALAVAAPGGAAGCLVDRSVYSRNRHFRMAYSCKAGSGGRALWPTARYATGPGCAAGASRVLLDSLVANVDPGAELLRMHNEPGPALAPARERGVGVVVPGGGGGVRVCWRRGPGETEVDPPDMAELRRLAEAAVPFFEVVGARRASGLDCRVRTVAFCGADGAVAYGMIGPGSHWCENVGRCHSSNHSFFVARFGEGRYCQKCYDPDCARYRSPWMPLPPGLCWGGGQEER